SGRHEVFSSGIFHLHVHPRAQRDGHHSICLHGHEPHYHYSCVRAAGLPHGRDLRILVARIAIPQALRAKRDTDLHPAPGHRDRGAVILFATGVSQRATICQHARRSHHVEGVRRLRRDARWFWISRLARRRLAAGFDDSAHGTRAAGGFVAGLRLRHLDLHLSQRCASSRPLGADPSNTPRTGAFSWTRRPRNTLVLALPASAWAAPASASASSSPTIWPRRSVTHRPRPDSTPTRFSASRSPRRSASSRC